MKRHIKTHISLVLLFIFLSVDIQAGNPLASLEKLESELPELRTHMPVSDDDYITALSHAVDTGDLTILSTISQAPQLRLKFSLRGHNEPSVLELFVQIIKAVERQYRHDQKVVLVSFASGDLRHDYLLAATLFSRGYRKIILHVIDIIYKSPLAIAQHKDLKDVPQNELSLQHLFFREWSSEGHSMFIKGVKINSIRQLLRDKKVETKSIFEPWQTELDGKPELHLGIWGSGQDFIRTVTQNKTEDYAQPTIFFAIQVAISLGSKMGWHVDDEALKKFLRKRQPCITEASCSHNSLTILLGEGSEVDIIISNIDFPALLFVSRVPEDLPEVTNEAIEALGELYKKIKKDEDISTPVETLKRITRTTSGPYEHSYRTFYDLFGLTAKQESSSYSCTNSITKVCKTPLTLDKYIEALSVEYSQDTRPHDKKWYIWDKTKEKFVKKS